MHDFVISARKVDRGRFHSEPGPSQFLAVPPNVLPSPSQVVSRRDTWVKRLRRRAVWGRDARTGGERGDILIFVHGYNNSQAMVIRRHRRLQADLTAAGFKGALVTFDWPSADMTLNYLGDRHDAKRTAMQLVDDGIRLLAREQGPGCTINVHVLAHSTGAYVVREAFDDADDATLDHSGWLVSQIAFIGADVSAGSMSASESSTASLYRHCIRLTNYSNDADAVLKVSNAKRLGMAPRVGRAGLPADAPAKAVNVNCTAYFQQMERDAVVKAQDQRETLGTFSHSWHIGNRVFARDLFETLRGDLGLGAMPTRVTGDRGEELTRTPSS